MFLDDEYQLCMDNLFNDILHLYPFFNGLFILYVVLGYVDQTLGTM